MANYSDQPFEGITVKKGQFVTSYKNMASDLGQTIQETRTAIKKLKSTGEITCTSTNKFTLITVTNWEEYQTFPFELTSEATQLLTNEQQTTNKQLTNKQQTTNNNKRKIKKDKNDKNSVCDAHTHTHARDNQSEKIFFAEFVSMTQAEYDDLIEKHSEERTKRMIEMLDDYKGSTGKEYKSDYKTIRRWVVSKLEEEEAKAPKEPNYLHEDNFNHAELEKLTRR